MGQAEVIDTSTVDLPGSIYPSPWNIADILIVGRAARGELRVGASGIVNSVSGAIGDLEGSIGLVSVYGDGASWFTRDNLTIGNYGHGTLTIGPGGLVSNAEAYVGMFADSVGSVTVSGQGAHWRATDRILIGAAGDATLTISDGGMVTSNQGVIGNTQTSTGTVTVSGRDASGKASTWNIDSQLTLGSYGSSSQLNIIDGGQVILGAAGVLYVQAQNGANSTVVVSGTDSKLAALNVVVGVDSDTRSVASLRVDAGAKVIAASQLGIGNGLGSAGLGSFGTVTLSGQGSQFLSTYPLSIGNLGGNGVLTIEDGAYFTSGSGTIGTIGPVAGGPTGRGLVAVTGSGSQWFSTGGIGLGVGRASGGTSGGAEIVYDPSFGSLIIEDGGKVTGTQIQIINGSAKVSGKDSQGNASTWLASGELHVGSNSGTAHGTLLVSDGALLISQRGAYIGGEVDNVMTVSGRDAVWENSGGDINLGYARKIGALHIANGAHISNAAGAVLGFSNSIGGTGIVSVSGASSRWANQGSLVLGEGQLSVSALEAVGRLTVTDGAYVSSAAGYLGGSFSSIRNYGGTGIALVSGSDAGGNASSWNIANELVVGVGGNIDRGTGTLTISDGGLVSAGAVQIAQRNLSTGTINIGAAVGDAAAAAGTLNTPTIAFGAGNGLLNLNYLDANYVVGSAISGQGKIAHNGMGVTHFSGDSSAFSGQMQINAGTIQVSGALGNAASTTTVNAAGALRGTGTLGGEVTIANGGRLIAKQGETFSIGRLTLNAGSNLDVALGAAGGAGLLTVVGDLTLGGTLNISNLGGFGKGVYRLIDYGGTLTDNGMSFGALPINVTANKLSLQTSIANQINLLSGVNATLNFWDGPGAADNNVVDGGMGTWNATHSNWTDSEGETNGVWAHDFAVFQGNAGTVTVDNSQGNIRANGMQFAVDGYVVDGDAVTLADVITTIRVGVGTAASQSMTATIAAALNGVSELIKTDHGTLILQGNNTYSEGTRIEGGALQVSSDSNLGNVAGGLIIDNAALATTATFSTARATVLSSGYAMVDTLANTTLSLTGLLSGQGSLVKQGGGTLVLAGANSYLGNTLVQAGTLKGDAARIRGHLLNDATTIFEQAADATFNGNVSGAGTVVKDGGAALNLAGVSTAAWRIDGGTLRSDASRFSGSVAIAADGTMNFDQALDATYAGVLSGTGALNKTGSNLLALSSDSTGFTGHTEVTAGALAVTGKLGGTVNVASGATLGGGGHVGATVVATGGTIAPALVASATSVGETLRVTGNLDFQNGSTYATAVYAAGLSDLISVSGHATLNGTVHVAKHGAIFAPGQQWTILSATQGITGVFNDLHEDLPYVGLFLSYDANNAYLNITRNDAAFCLDGFTYNQCSTATGAESLGQTHALYQALASQGSNDEAAYAFDQVSGEMHASLKTALIEDSRFVRDAAITRLGQLADNGATPAPAVWAQGLGSWARTDSDGNAERLSHDTTGLLLGADMPVSDTWRLGWLGGYSRSTLRVNERRSSASSDNYHLGLYSGAQWGNLGLRSGLAYSWHDIKASRTARFPGFVDSLKSDYRAGTAQAFAELGYRIDTSTTAVIEPFVNVAHIRLRTNGYTEQGGAAALSSRAQTTDTTFTTVGVRGSTALTLGQAPATAHLALGWKHAFGDTTPKTNHAFEGSDRFTVAGAPIARNAALLETGLDIQLAPLSTLGLSYSGQLANSARQHAVKADITIRF